MWTVGGGGRAHNKYSTNISEQAFGIAWMVFFLAPRVCVFQDCLAMNNFFHKRRVIWHSNFVIIVIMRLFTDGGILELSQCAVSNAYTQFRRCHLKLFNFQFLGAWFKWYWPLKGILPASFVHRHSVQTWVSFLWHIFSIVAIYFYNIMYIFLWIQVDKWMMFSRFWKGKWFFCDNQSAFD